MRGSDNDRLLDIADPCCAIVRLRDGLAAQSVQLGFERAVAGGFDDRQPFLDHRQRVRPMTGEELPCIAALPAGWTMGGATVRNGDAGFWLDSDRFGENAVEVHLRPADACLVDEGLESPSDDPAWRQFDAPGTRPTRTYLSDSACVTYDITPQVDAQSIHTLDDGLASSLDPSSPPRSTADQD